MGSKDKSGREAKKPKKAKKAKAEVSSPIPTSDREKGRSAG